MTEEQKDAQSSKRGKAMVKPQPSGDMKRNWVDQYYEELNQVLHRFNYFLVFTSFMFVAFVTLITSSKSNDLDWMIIAVAIVGIILSLFFFQVNYQQTRVACEVAKHKLNTPLPPEYVETKRWMRDSFSDTARYLRREFSYIAKERPASHTWIIPFAFILFWVFSLVGWCIKGM